MFWETTGIRNFELKNLLDRGEQHNSEQFVWTPHAALLRDVSHRIHSGCQSPRPQQVLQSSQRFFNQVPDPGEVDSGTDWVFLKASTAPRNHHHSRVFLWHKITELNYKEESPNKSAGHYQQVKVILNNEGPFGCVESIYDHKYDYYESKNLLINNTHCSLFFHTYDEYSEPNLLKKYIDPEAGYKHCKGLYTHQHDTKINECKEKYALLLSKKVIIILEALKPFVLKGNLPFYKYSLEKHDDCKVPVINDVHKPIFYDPTICGNINPFTKKSSCNFPMISNQWNNI